MRGVLRNSHGSFTFDAAEGATIHPSNIMSAEFKKAEIRVFSFAPEYLPIEITVIESGDDSKTHMPVGKIKEKGQAPAEMPGSDGEMAEAVIFLCKNMYLSGEVAAVDGGVLNQMPGRQMDPPFSKAAY